MSSPLRCLADVTAQPAEWLWPARIPRGAITLIVGDPGRGKSLLTLEIAARVSAGRDWPDCEAVAEAGDVLLLSAEDSPARTVRSRLLALGADLRRIHYLNSGLWRDFTDRDPYQRFERVDSPTAFGYVPAQAFFALERDARRLKASLEELPECRLVVIDPVPAYLRAIDVADLDEARRYLGPLATIADASGAAIVAVAHRDQSLREPANRRQYPLRALAAMARTIHLVERLPDDPRRVFAPVKNNLAGPQPPLAFEVRSDWDGTALIEWSPASVDISWDDLASQATKAAPRQQRLSEIDRATAWLQGALAAGPVPTRDLDASAHSAGFSERTLYRARARLRVRATNDRQIGGTWTCALPSGEEPEVRGCQDLPLAASAASAASATLLAASSSVIGLTDELKNPNPIPSPCHSPSAA
jgi:putative DNA primase/helicase